MSLPLRREKSEVRRQQIVDAVRALLADSPLDQLSTRQIARELGVTQPALFRHFASRDELLLAVIAATRAELGELARRVIEGPGDATARLEALATAFLRHLEHDRGLPRLLFANVASGEGPVLGALKQLYSMQSSLITELVRDGQRDGSIDPTLDAHDAATLFVGVLQSATLIRRLQDESGPLEREGRRLLAIWFRGVRPPVAREAPAAPVATPEPRQDGLIALDVRPLLAQGIDPLDTVLEALERVGPGGVLKLDVPFRPTPLIALLSSRGHAVRDERVGREHFSVEVVHGGRPVPEDRRELEAPGPLERVLAACATLPPGGVYLARVPRHPRLLLPHLEERGLGFAVYDEPDESALLRVYRPK